MNAQLKMAPRRRFISRTEEPSSCLVADVRQSAVLVRTLR